MEYKITDAPAGNKNLGMMDGVRPLTEENVQLALVGVLREHDQDGIVELDRKSELYGRTIYILRKDLNGAPFGMKVVVEVTGTSTEGVVYGKITEVLGDPGRPDVAIEGIIRAYNLRKEFPAEVTKEVEAFPNDPADEDIAEELKNGRKDLRELHTITIDGLDARDLDDAIDVERTKNGYRLWVHIADVTHYVKPGTALNREAIARGNSVYLADRVLPMLPPRLSNGLCSLNPMRNRLTLSCRIDYDRQGNITDGEVAETVICSKVRSSYSEVREIFAGAEPAPDRPEWFKDMLFTSRELAKILNDRRRRRGALNFDFPETKVVLDAEGEVSEIKPEIQDEANQLIEAFMIAANEYVAALSEKKSLPAVYRVHEHPDPDHLSEVIFAAREYGVRAKLSMNPRPIDVQKLLNQLEPLPVGKALSQLVLRSLAKARYDVEDLGHFGLASRQYCHFTSPIRRYADDCVHRGLKSLLHGHKLRKNVRGLRDIAMHISMTEQMAEDAERDTVKQKVVEYYSKRLGEEYDGTISGISPVGFYVQLENTAEGSVFFASLNDGYYRVDQIRMVAENTRTKERFHVGDKVKIRVAAANLERRFLDFALVEHEDIRGRVHRKDEKHSPQGKRVKKVYGTPPRSKFGGRNQKAPRRSDRHGDREGSSGSGERGHKDYKGFKGKSEGAGKSFKGKSRGYQEGYKGREEHSGAYRGKEGRSGGFKGRDHGHGGAKSFGRKGKKY